MKILKNRNYSYIKKNYGEVTNQKDFKGIQIINNIFYNFKTTTKHFHSNDFLEQNIENICYNTLTLLLLKKYL